MERSLQCQEWEEEIAESRNSTCKGPVVGGDMMQSQN